jgi:hypothetical protein
MRVRFENRVHGDTYRSVWVNPNFVVSVIGLNREGQPPHTSISMHFHESPEEDQYFVVKGEAKDVVASLSAGDHG